MHILNLTLSTIQISTDNHIGYKEVDSVIGQDSFLAFKEVLTTAVDKKCDFLLLGGDLYHEMKPSITTTDKVTSLLNEYVPGPQNIRFETQNYHANYMDGHLEVQLPIFMIHGIFLPHISPDFYHRKP